MCAAENAPLFHDRALEFAFLFCVFPFARIILETRRLLKLQFARWVAGRFVGAVFIFVPQAVGVGFTMVFVIVIRTRLHRRYCDAH